MGKIKVIQKKSVISENKNIREIIRTLGLRGIRTSKVHKDNNCIRGMINKVVHLVDYELIDEKASS